MYAPSGQNETFTCAVNGSELLWEMNMLNLAIPHHANELEENGIFSGSLRKVGGLFCSTLTVLVSDYSHNADICCQGRRTSNPLETCCTRLLEYGMLKNVTLIFSTIDCIQFFVHATETSKQRIKDACMQLKNEIAVTFGYYAGRPLSPFLELPQYLRDSGSVNLSWTANVTEGVDHNYTIVIHNVTSTSQEVLVETTSLHYMFDKCGEFDIHVIAVNGAGQSAPSNTVRVSLPLLPDITPVSQSLKHRVWKENGSITLQINFEVSINDCLL